MKHLVTGVLAGALTIGMAAAPAEGAVTGAHESGEARGDVATHGVERTRGDSARTLLRLTLTYPTGNTSGTRTVVLRCDPPGGNHPAAEQACADLAASHGAIDHDPARNQICPMIYRPVIAQATGHWRERAVRFRKQYGNDCVMRSRTGRVFAF
ncbi:SSI family serine proteinase inhibitor [Spirillospora sp. NPDC052269]